MKSDNENKTTWEWMITFSERGLQVPQTQDGLRRMIEEEKLKTQLR